MKKLLAIVVLGLFISSSEIIAVPTDFNLKILNRRTGADAWVRISKYRTNADVHWFIDGECNATQKYSAEEAEIFLTNSRTSADITVYITSNRTSADSWTCILNMDELNDDQKRVMTSGEAYSKGADYIVVGRPITQAKDIEEAIKDYS